MIVTALALMSVSIAAQDTSAVATAPALTCAVMGGKVAADGPAVDYKGVRYSFCCNMCQGGFQKNPDKAITADRNKGKTIGLALFDPVSGSRMTAKLAKATEDYNGVRYLFASADEKTTFDADRAKFTAMPEKEALYCPVEKEKIAGYSAAGSYRDYEGVRYYFCCAGCPEEFTKKPADYAKVAAIYVTGPKPLVAVPDKADATDKKDGEDFVAAEFSCKHCGRPMAINSPDDAKATCSACHCGKMAGQCKG
jgi:YHS domain-containing protein